MYLEHPVTTDEIKACYFNLIDSLTEELMIRDEYSKYKSSKSHFQNCALSLSIVICQMFEFPL